MLTKRQKNKLKTAGYFIKRLKDCKYGVVRIFNDYAMHDPRNWTVLVDPAGASIYITCYNNKDFNNEVMFEFHCAGDYFPKNFYVSTESIEVIVQLLVDKKIPTIGIDSRYYSSAKK